MPWTPSEKARFAAEHLAWTLTGRIVDGIQEVRVTELPGFVVYAENDREMSLAMPEALTAFLLSYFADDEEPPRPAGSKPLPWDPDFVKPRAAAVVSPWIDARSESLGAVQMSGMTIAPTI